MRVAFVKFGGLAAAGTERWLQMMAASLPRERFHVEYFYCDPAPYLGSTWVHPPSDPGRERYLREAGVKLVRFRVGCKDLRTPAHDWVDTDFWDVFDPKQFDLVQTAKAGPAEYPYDRMPLPVVEFVALDSGVDRSRSIAWSIHPSNWQRAHWLRHGGRRDRSCVIPVPALPPASDADLRLSLGIEPTAVVAGFHQRPDETTFSDVPLKCFGRLAEHHCHFVLMGGATRYRQQASELRLRNVHFLEQTSGARDISRFLNTLDVFAHGRGDGETFGTVLAEAMMHGRPCLSHRSRCAANAQGETMGPGGLFAADDVQYAAMLRRLIDSPSLRAEMGALGREHAREFYSLERAVRHLAEVYERAGSSGKTSAAVPCLAYGASPQGLRLVWHPDSDGLARDQVEFGLAQPEWGTHWFPSLARLAGGGVLDLSSTIGLFTLSYLAQEPDGSGGCVLWPDARFAESVRRTLSVNAPRPRATVEPRVGPEPDADAGTRLAAVLRRAEIGIVVVDARSARGGWMARLAASLGDARPVVLVEPVSGDGHHAGADWARCLGELHYECLRTRRSGTIARGAPGDDGDSALLFLHRTQHRELRRQLVAAARRWSSARRASGVAKWSVRVLAGARRRARSLFAGR